VPSEFSTGGLSRQTTADHHTAVVARVKGTVIHVRHQNWNGVRAVAKTRFDLAELTAGTVEFYRPAPLVAGRKVRRRIAAEDDQGTRPAPATTPRAPDPPGGKPPTPAQAGGARGPNLPGNPPPVLRGPGPGYPVGPRGMGPGGPPWQSPYDPRQMAGGDTQGTQGPRTPRPVIQAPRPTPPAAPTAGQTSASAPPPSDRPQDGTGLVGRQSSTDG
jgi:hypothetical protein